ncbi:hypothetical protein ACFYRD_37405 [Streptomyces hirsutus]|uniref:hypothetical protein n=1 Tax=Streptomyces hirsutus TaxID=35620 RepID=UPI0036993191
MFHPDEPSRYAIGPEAGALRDADIEQAANAAEGRARDAHYDAGFCTHGSAVAYRPDPHHPAQHGLQPGQVRCTAGCNTVFESDDAWTQACTDPYSDPIRRH